MKIVGGTNNIYPFKKYTKPEFITKTLQHESTENCSEYRTCSTWNELSTN